MKLEVCTAPLFLVTEWLWAGVSQCAWILLQLRHGYLPWDRGQWHHTSVSVSPPFIAQVPGGALQGAVLVCAVAGCSCVSPLTSPFLEGQSSSTCSAEVCFCSGVMGRVHSPAMRSQMEHSVIQHIAWSRS